MNQRRALHTSPPEKTLCEDSGDERGSCAAGFGECVEKRDNGIIHYIRDQLALTCSMTESGIRQAGENER